MPGKSESTVAEYMKIRRYVVNLITRGKGESSRLPTILELSEKFQVSRPTVSKAMKTLTDEGLVIGKRGIGSFTNPASPKMAVIRAGGFVRKKTIGILIGDGLVVHYDSFYSDLLAGLLHCLSKLPVWIHLLSLGGGGVESICDEIRAESLDALVWFHPSRVGVEAAKRLFSEGLPIVLGDVECPDLCTVSMNYYGLGRQIGEKLVEDGRRNLVFLPASPPWSMQLQGICDVYAERGIPLNENLFFRELSTAFDDLRKALRFGVPIDAVCVKLIAGKQLMELLLSENPEIFKTCLIIEGEDVVNVPENKFDQLVYSMVFTSFSEKVRDILSDFFEGVREIRHEICGEREIHLLKKNKRSEK